MADEKSLAVAYNIKRRSRKGEITHKEEAPEASPRKERLKAMLFSEGGEVPDAEDAIEYTDEDLEFPEEPMVPQEEETPEMKRKSRLLSLLNEDQACFLDVQTVLMTINNIKELSRLIDLCRKKGIDSVEIDNIKLKLGNLEPKVEKFKGPELVETPRLTDEDLLYWSASNIEGAL